MNDIHEIESEVLYKKLIETLSEYNKTGSLEALKAYKAAKKAYNDYQLSRQDLLKNDSEVIAFLKQEGYLRIDNHGRKIRNDIKKGLIKKQNNGYYSKKDVLEYAKWRLVKVNNDIEGLTAEKLKLEIEIAHEKAEKLRRENEILEGKYIPKEEIEKILTQRLIFLRSEYENMVHAMATNIIKLTNGDESKTPELIKFMINFHEDWFDKYSQPIEIVISDTKKILEEE